MRFVAGRGADKVCCRQGRCSEAVAGRGPSAQRTAGRDAAAKSHREDAAGRGAAAKSHREAGKERAPAVSKERAPAASRKEHPVLQANKKESGKTHSLKPALVMTALVRVTGARPRGSSQLPLCSLELLW